ncbi:transglutaminase-like cysteine peptidase [Pseudohoeflea suaedae]|uniref:transglutaminase-like cysteine peptidase n=1 Tax=Pseudohoeflea suaedae TaxID=877384 RepID=UPI001FCF131C|nr:transglutaminase-like cysteine peptidase [Pseudohoeflea suaedae]
MKKARIYLSSAACAAAFLTSPAAHASVWLKTGGETSRPYGHVEYCRTHSADCRAQSANVLPPANLSMLNHVNRTVNRSIKPMSDIKQFGKREYWTANTNAGDCEDFALAKRRALMARGFKPANLLLTMTRRRGEAHTVLVARTRDGDFVLDNMLDDVLPVNRTGLGYVKMQSDRNSARWVNITGKTQKVAEVQ